MKRLSLLSLSVLLLAFLLGGCERVKQFVRTDTSNLVDPTPLEKDFRSTLDVDTLWSKKIGKGAEELYLKLTPSVIAGVLFVSDRYGRLIATDINDGTELWAIHDKNVNYTTGPGGGEELVIIGTQDARVIARNAKTGELRWVARVSSEVLAAPTEGSGVVVVRTGDGNVFGLDSKTGSEIWNYDRRVPSLTLRGTSSPVINGSLVLSTFGNGRIVALDLFTGKVSWDSPIAIASGRSDLERMVDVDTEPVIVGTTCYVSSFHGGIVAMSTIDGQIEWTREISSYSNISVSTEHVYVADEEGAIWALDRRTGTSVWKQEALKHRFTNGAIYFDGYIIAGDFEGFTHWFDAKNGDKVFQEKVSRHRILAPAINTKNAVLTYSSRGTLTAMQIARR